MDDRSWMYRDSPQGLRRIDYCNRVQGFINFATSIPRNFTRGGIRYPCRKCQNKKYLHPDVVMMHLLHKGFIENYQCWYAHGEVYVSERRMKETVVGSTFTASNMHEAANDNTNPYRNMVMDAMRMNQGNVSQCPSVRDEVFQVSELVEPYRVAPSIELDENSNFCVFDDSLVDVDVEELNAVLSSSGQANVDEEDDIHIEDCDEGDDNSIDDEEEENSD